MSDGGGKAFGCLFCTTGKEQTVIRNLQTVCPEIRALTAMQEKFKSTQGKKTKIVENFLPGYVFFSGPADLAPQASFPRDYLIRILYREERVWQLSGEDERFAQWLFEQDGLLKFSKAYQEGQIIRIISGPLKDLEGQIRKIDRRGHSGEVVLEFQGRQISVWLGFDLIGKSEEKRAEETK